MNIVDKPITRDTDHVKPIIKAFLRGAAAGAKRGARRVEGTVREIGFIFDRAAMRPFGHEVDRAGRRAFARHQRGRTLEDFDPLEVARVHYARSHALRPDLDAIIKWGD